MYDGDAEALRGLLGRVLLEPVGLVTWTRYDEDLVGRELPECVLDRLHRVGVADLGLDASRLRLGRLLGPASDFRGLTARLVLVRGEPLERREVGSGSDHAHLGIGASMLAQAVAQERLLDGRGGDNEQAFSAHVQADTRKREEGKREAGRNLYPCGPSCVRSLRRW